MSTQSSVHRVIIGLGSYWCPWRNSIDALVVQRVHHWSSHSQVPNSKMRDTQPSRGRKLYFIGYMYDILIRNVHFILDQLYIVLFASITVP